MQSPESRVLHIDITGHDRAGVTYSLTNILAEAGVRILDIGQAVIHDALALGILVELTKEFLEESPESPYACVEHAGWLVGGDDKKAEELLQKAVDNSASYEYARKTLAQLVSRTRLDDVLRIASSLSTCIQSPASSLDMSGA